MDKKVVPIYRRRPAKRSSGDLTLWSPSAMFLRATFWVKEAFTFGEKRKELKRLRTTWRAVRRDLDLFQSCNPSGFSPGSGEMQDKKNQNLNWEATWEELDEKRARLEVMRQEGEEVRGIVQAAGEDKALVAEGLREYLQVHPESGLAYSYLGGTLQKTGDFESGLVAYANAVRLAGYHPIAAVLPRIQIGNLLQEKGEIKSAIAEFRRFIIDCPPTNEGFLCGVYLRLGNALEQSGDTANARVAWKQALRHDLYNTIAKEAQEKLKASKE